MNSIKILHTGDLHLGSPMGYLGDRAKSRQVELLYTLKNIIELAKNEAVDAVLIAGDLFDSSKPDSALADRVYNILEGLGDIPVYLVLGNHDWGLDCRFPPNVHVFGDKIEKYSLKNADIYGASFGDRHCCKSLAEGFCAEDSGRINILLMHGDTERDTAYNPVTEEQIKSSKADYIALGHQHTYAAEAVGSTTVAFCGIPEGRGFDECGENGVIIAEVGIGYADLKFVPLCKRQYERVSVDITDLEDNVAIAEAVAERLGSEENAYSVILKGTKSTFADCRFLKGFLEKDYYYIEVSDLSKEGKDKGYTLKNLFMEKCDNEAALDYGLAALRGEKVDVE